MGVSVYSFASAVVFFNIGLLVIAVLRRNTNYLVRNSTFSLLFLFFSAIIRIILPIDLIQATIIHSKDFLPFIEKILAVSVYNRISIGKAMQVIWIAGTIFIVLMELFHFRRRMKEIQSCKAVQNLQLTRVLKNEISKTPFKVTVSPDIEVPQVTGFVKAHIFLPPLNVSDYELSLILLHEIEHIKGRDIYIKLFYILIKAIFWWNPIVHIFQHELENMLELRCDISLTKNMDYEKRIIYLDTILKVMKQISIGYAKLSCCCSNLIGYEMQGVTKQRFEVILNQVKATSKFTNIKAVFFTLMLFLCSYFIIVQPMYFPATYDIEGTIDVNESNSYIVVYPDKTLELFVDEEFYCSVMEHELRDVPYNNLKIVRKDKKE